MIGAEKNKGVFTIRVHYPVKIACYLLSSLRF